MAGKRQRTAAVQKLRLLKLPVNASASWTAAVLCRFAIDGLYISAVEGGLAIYSFIFRISQSTPANIPAMTAASTIAPIQRAPFRVT